jgi:hypothetical protein
MNKVTKTITTGLAAAGLALGGLTALQPAEQALAAPGCPSGMTCMWTKTDGGGSEYRYSRYANHTHAIGSLNYNYSTNSISFWTGKDGSGTKITSYTTRERGFRNWSSSNHNRCKSHIDR